MKIFTIGLILWLAIGLQQQPKTYKAYPLLNYNVIDGDTLDVTVKRSSGNRSVRIRLAGVDTPELSTPAGLLAKERTSFLLDYSKKRLLITRWDKGYYGRTLGYIELDNGSLNAMLIERGWRYNGYNRQNNNNR